MRTFLSRIKQSLDTRYRGTPPNFVQVNRDDLRQLVHHFERLDEATRAIAEAAETARIQANRIFFTGDLVRYSTGRTAIARLESPHAGGWHATHCLGGIVYVTDNQLRHATELDLQVARTSKFYCLDDNSPSQENAK